MQSRAQSSSLVRLFLAADKVPLWLLTLSAVVGVVAGMLATGFQFGLHQILAWRVEGLSHWAQWGLPRWLLAMLVTAVMTVLSLWMTFRFAPEAAGSGIPEIEGALDNLRPVRWWRVLPVKIFGGFLAQGGGLVLGREGPTVQLGGAAGKMVADLFRVSKDNAHALLAAGAAGGLSAAFNAPLAGVMFVIEEMRPQFRYGLISIKCVFIGTVVANVVYRTFIGQDASIEMPSYSPPELDSLALYLLLGGLFGAFGILFNKAILKTQDWYANYHQGRLDRRLVIGGILGAALGLMTVYGPDLTGGGIELIPAVTVGSYTVGALLLLFVGRVLTTLLCFGSGAPGGIFAPMLALGTLFGMGFGVLCQALLPGMAIQPGTFAIAGMGALFAATVRAPLTGIILVIEMTNNYLLILPLLITCLGATMVAQALGGQPLYGQLLGRTLAADAQAKREADAKREAEAQCETA
ncbi:H(+)/Cl(-) exchange transporter ClcA [Gallaecimonas kandeliae]|uniref:H(+)/Cl(-) exchange transporter ClcA n=1 Tax=Gallaecimonas kandeliae TaxID=3029055 RepID=UPI0026478DEA|nr:H(+)/Cl(-) exchange transporter ClcA [Gallaecimonas kandeliae]WKE66320.1 H(+)/Cl(-) exchange transporter ClcA [Gallaecimonas kandeliae]